MKKNLLIALAVIIILILVTGSLVLLRGNEDTWLCSNGQWVKHGQPNALQPTKPCAGAVACTMEAKLCPDGSAVGRTGANCEFAPCPSSSAAALANPASVNCQQKGGNLVIKKRGDGGEYGLCYFEDNRACEEWAMLRGNCPVGGVKTTGFDTEAQKYCAWSGGSTFAVDNAVCIFKDGSQCLDDAFYNGTCQPGEKKVK